MKVKLMTVNNEIEARLIQGKLKEGGLISYIVTGQSYSPGILGVNNGMVPYDIFVAEEDVNKAKELLNKQQS